MRILRIVYRPELDGRSFKVQENRPVNNIDHWRTVDGFTNLLVPRAAYPEAQVHPSCERRQAEIESRQHTFERDNTTDTCHYCGQPSWFTAHHARGAA